MPALKSLAGRLFKVVFGWYLLLAIVVTAIQLGLEYSAIRATVLADLEALGRSFAPGVSDALWTYDRQLLGSLAKGVGQAAIVTGVKIEDGRGDILASEGHIPAAPVPSSNATFAPFQMHEMPLWSASLTDGRVRRLLGRMVLYSDRKVIVDRVRYSFVVILINSIVKTAGLWLIFYWVFTRRLSHPLQHLSEAISRLTLSEKDEKPSVLDYPHKDEIGVLVGSLNDMRARLKSRTEELEHANRELEEFSYSMSHDLRTPLRALDGYSKILLEEHEGKLDGDAMRLLGSLRDNARRMGRQMDDMLRFLHVGRQKMAYRVIDLGVLATEIVGELEAVFAGREIRLCIGDLPLAWGDRGMLRLVLRNLLSNAVKFSPPHRAALVELTAVEGDGETVYTVTDHGIGFDARYADKLFRTFEHAHSTDQYDGSGIGLAIVKRIAERHGGRVWADGKVGEGASFHFALPSKPCLPEAWPDGLPVIGVV